MGKVIHGKILMDNEHIKDAHSYSYFKVYKLKQK